MTAHFTDYGFVWDGVEVTAMFEHRGTHVVGVATDHRLLQVYVSPKGRSIRVWLDGKELRAVAE